jgi:YD repeat-containing protein
MRRSVLMAAMLFGMSAAGPALAQGTPIIIDRTFDARGNVASETHPYYAGATPQVTTFRYDGLDRLVLQTNPDATTRSFVHDIDRRTLAGTSVPLARATSTDELGRQAVTVQDAAERPVELTRYLGGSPVVEQRTYDRVGRLVGLADPANNLWTYQYDLRGLRLQASDPDLGVWAYGYDLAGRLTLQTDARGLDTILTYDALGRMLTKTSERPDTTLEVVTNVYDEVRTGFFNKGGLTSATSTVASVTIASQTFDRDGEGNTARQTWTVPSGTYTATTGFAPGGEVLWKAFPDGDSVGSAGTPWTYDAAGRLEAVPGIVTATSFEADGQTSSITYANGVTTSFLYDPGRRWLDQVETGNSAGTLLLLDYLRDYLGRISSVTSNRVNQNWTYTYDDLDRLTFADNLNDNLRDQTFGFDAAGNMVSNSALGTYTYPTPGTARPHAQLTAGSRTYSYDANGNTLSDGTRTLTWDGQNRLLSVNAVSFTYAPDGMRLRKTSGSTTTLYLGADIEKKGSTWTKYIHPDAVRIGSTTTWLHRDHSQSLRLRTSAAGTLVEAAAYTPYGSQAPGLAISRGYYRREARSGDRAPLPQRPLHGPRPRKVHLTRRLGTPHWRASAPIAMPMPQTIRQTEATRMGMRGLKYLCLRLRATLFETGSQPTALSATTEIFDIA